MISFLSIVRLTIKNALRSHIFQLLMLLLLLCIFLIPNTIVGDDTAHGYIQIALKYSLGTVSFVLSLSAIWLGCFLMCGDTENYQLHMVVSKPISRVTIWLGKYCGILLIHVFLMVFACTIIYATVLWQFNQQGFSDQEKARIQNEVLVGRRVFYPNQPNIHQEAFKKLEAQNAEKIAKGQKIDTSPATQRRELRMIQNDILRNIGEIKYGASRSWEYSNLPTGMDENRPVFLRFRTYVNKVSSEDQRMTRGMWAVWVAAPVKPEDKNRPVEQQFYQVPLSSQPEQFLTGVFHEKVLKATCIQDSGKVKIAFLNVDPKASGLFFQPKDGPKLLIKISGFTQNFFRGMIVMFIQLAVLAGLACAAASAMSMPTAVFIVISYLMFGSFATFMGGTTFFGSAADHVGYTVSKILLTIVIPVQSFEISPFIANGELIEISYIWGVIWKYLILRGLPIYLFGIWLYWRRELGLVIKK
jgi:ABC-type multidrug transport system fused ATPase/permease subunit